MAKDKIPTGIEAFDNEDEDPDVEIADPKKFTWEDGDVEIIEASVQDIEDDDEEIEEED